MDETDDPDRWIQLNSQFHGTIYQAANRPRLVALIDQLRNTSAPYIRQIISTSEYRLQAVAEHRAIYQTCVHRDGLAAEQETQKHLMAVCARILQPNLPVQADSQRPRDGAGAS
jgi:DNA-binding GntR family transcriptional regulator